MRSDSGRARILAGGVAALAMALALGSGILTTRHSAEAGCSPAAPPPAPVVERRAAAPERPAAAPSAPGPVVAGPVVRVEAVELPVASGAQDINERLRGLAVG